MAVQISGNDITVPRDGSFTRNVTIGGTLTYEDVTNIDSVGLVTARTGIEIGARPGVAASISVDGNMIVSGISTFGGDVQVPDKIIHAGDTNTAIRFPAADTITAETGGSERARIDSSGVIYTQSAGDIRSIASAGSLSLSGGGTNLGGQIVLSGGNADSNIVFKAQASTATPAERLRIDSSGRLLLGTTTEGHTNGDDLTIATSGGTGMTIRSGTSDTGSIFFSDGTSGAAEYAGLVQYDHANNFMRFYAGGSEQLRVNSSGHLLLGTTTAAVTAGKALMIAATDGARIKLCDSDLGVTGNDGYEMIASNNGTAYLWNRENTDLLFGTNNTERVRITSDGKFGVGLTNPTGKFAVSDGTVIGEINPYSSSSTCFIGTRSNHSITFKTNASGHATLSTDGDFMVGTTSNSSSNGVGLKLNYGTTNPTFNCVINQATGNHSFYHLYNTNGTHNAYRFYVQVNGGVANYQSNNVDLSDERMKKNITNMGSVYDTFKKFTFKDFNYIDDEASESKKHGLIAQDVETIDSDLITEDFKIAPDSEGNDVYRKALKTEQFMMIGMKALQEAMTKIETLEAEVAALKSS
jgi:hypothetical protein